MEAWDLQPLLSFLVLLALYGTFDYLLARVAELSPYLWLATIPAGAAASFLSVWATAAVLVFRLSTSQALVRVRDVIRWSILGPLVAVELRLVAFCSLLLVPIATAILWTWRVVPVHAAHSASIDSELPYVGQLLVSYLNFLGRFSPFLLIFPACLLIYLVNGRMLWLLSNRHAA